MRTIDADALKGPLELQRASYARIGATERAEAYANCLWEIAQAPTIGGWISVEDALPENDDHVLVCTKTKAGRFNIVIGYYMDGAWRCGMNSNVMYWQPLPEPPKEDDNDGN